MLHHTESSFLPLFEHSFLHTLEHTIQLLPFLFLTYLFMEWLEHRTGSRTQALIRRAGKAGPLLGGALGVVPQCGFSAAASNFYAGGLITTGTLIAVFLSTSDEMLPIFISEQVPVAQIITILLVKMGLGIITGFVLDFVFHRVIRKEIRYKNIHTLCESEHCKCDEGIFKSTIKHTLQIFLFIFLITFVLECVIDGVGEEHLKELVAFNTPILSELVAALIGLIPNCVSSVVIAELYVEGIFGAGAMMAGLLANAGIGVLVLCRINHKHMKHNVCLIIALYCTSVFWGVLIELLGIKF